MLSEFNPLSFMAMSNPELFLPDNDLSPMEFKFPAKPATAEFPHNGRKSEIASGSSQDDDHHLRQRRPKEKEEDDLDLLQEGVKEGFEVFKLKAEDEDGFRTPTSLEHKIPVMLQCPPAPRKQKPRPLKKKRKAGNKCWGGNIVCDLSEELESFLEPAFLADLDGKIKKIRRGRDRDEEKN